MRVTDLDPDLQSTCRRIPEDIRENLSVTEARLRCEEAREAGRLTIPSAPMGSSMTRRFGRRIHRRKH